MLCRPIHVVALALVSQGAIAFASSCFGVSNGALESG